MWLSRLTTHLVKATQRTGCFVQRSVRTNYKTLSVCYSTRQHQIPQVPSPVLHSLGPELDYMLVPRMMAISPLESLLTFHYSLPKLEAPNPHEELQPNLEYYECPSHQDNEDMGKGKENNSAVQCKNVLKIRRRKMNKHKYKKLMKRTKFLRRKIKDGRKRKKQARFEKDLQRIWKMAGLREPPVGWNVPKVFVKH
ncbi:small ribosomal subunit protein mS38 [Pelodytes ibericus]